MFRHDIQDIMNREAMELRAKKRITVTDDELGEFIVPMALAIYKALDHSTPKETIVEAVRTIAKSQLLDVFGAEHMTFIDGDW